MTQFHLVVKTYNEYYIFEAKRPLFQGFITYILFYFLNYMSSYLVM